MGRPAAGGVSGRSWRRSRERRIWPGRAEVWPPRTSQVTEATATMTRRTAITPTVANSPTMKRLTGGRPRADPPSLDLVVPLDPGLGGRCRGPLAHGRQAQQVVAVGGAHRV